MLVACPAFADDDKRVCATAYESAQEHRAAGRLIQASEALALCARSECPSFVEADCGRWFSEVQRELPSVVIAAKNPNGADTVAVKVFMDDALLAEQLDGRALPIDPGPHRLRFEHEGAAAIERELVIRVGHQNRVIEVDFGGGGASEPPDVAPEPAAVQEHDVTADSEPGPLRPYAYVAGAVGAAGIAGWAIVGLIAKGEQSDLEEGCAPNCAQGDVDSVQTKFLIADISLGLGVAGLASGVALFFLSQPGSATTGHRGSAWALDVSPIRGGGAAAVRGTF